MKLCTLAVAGASWIAISGSAFAADIIRFDATGVFTDGATLGGSININTVTGQVVSTTLLSHRSDH